MGWTKKRSVARYTQTIPPHVPLQASDYGYDSRVTLSSSSRSRGVQEGPPPSLQEEINAYPKLKSREVAGCREMRGHDRSMQTRSIANVKTIAPQHLIELLISYSHYSTNPLAHLSSTAMCRQTDMKIDDARVPIPEPPPLPVEKAKRKSSAAAELARSAAFRGSKFDKQGYCLSHPTVKLVQPLKDRNGKVGVEVTSPGPSKFFD